MKSFWLLQKQPWREQEWLLELFSREQGRLWVSSRSGADQLILYQGDWSEGRDWPKLPLLQSHWCRDWSDAQLACGCYLTELLAQLLPSGEALPELFDVYSQALTHLADGSHPSPWLRLFEQRLLHVLGYGFSWTEDVHGWPIEADNYYLFAAPDGWQKASIRHTDAIAGSWLIEFASGSHRPELWQMARKALQAALQHYLQRPLISSNLRAVFS